MQGAACKTNNHNVQRYVLNARFLDCTPSFGHSYLYSMNQSQYNALFSFIWNIATDVLVYRFDKSEYKKIILPMMVMRRIDVLLEPTKKDVLALKEALDKQGIELQDSILYSVSGYPFYNTSKFSMSTLCSEIDPQRLKQNFLDYLNGFSRDVLDIVEKLHLTQIVDNLTEAEVLGSILEKFTSGRINLSIKPVEDEKGNVLLPGLDNHTMGTIFEELLRRFNEENNVTEAGEHFTPRDYVKLLADLALLPVADKITDTTYSVYDGACGTGGILTIAQERITEIATGRGKEVKVHIYGQEQAPDTYATCKADLMISGQVDSFQYDWKGTSREYIAYGSTLSQDGHKGETYDFCISNPPFGTPWKEDLKKRGLTEKEKDKFSDPRFCLYDEEGVETSFLPEISDCQMMFLANNLSRMQNDTPLGTRIVEVHNGSSLFTGNAGSGASNLRQYIIENDLLEAIIAMPENDFYNTGIGTYVWVVTNRKEERRRGFVQLIDATQMKTPLRKNLGKKNCETNEQNRAEILRLLTDFKETETSRIFPNEEFGYYSVTVERPLRLRVKPDADITAPGILKADEVEKCRKAMQAVPEGTPLNDWNEYGAALKLTKTLKNKLRNIIAVRDPEAVAIEGEADKELRDVEQVPLRYPGGIDAFMEAEVLPYAPDAYYHAEAVVKGYELSFTKYFYKPVQLRTIADITSDIKNIEQRLDGVLADILNL